MKILMINKKWLRGFLPFLTNDEIFGITSGRYTSFGAYDEKTGVPMGCLTLWILPEDVRIIRFFTAPEYRGQGIARQLLAAASKQPGKLHLPIRYIYVNGSGFVDFLEALGFKQHPSRYTFVVGTPEDIVKIAVPKEKPPFTIRPAGSLPTNKIPDLVYRSPYDDLLQFPGSIVSMDRFSEASPVCIEDGMVTGAVLAEERDDCVDIIWYRGTSTKAVYYMLRVLGNTLADEISPRLPIRLLCFGTKENAAAKKYFSNSKSLGVGIFELSAHFH